MLVVPRTVRSVGVPATPIRTAEPAGSTRKSSLSGIRFPTPPVLSTTTQFVVATSSMFVGVAHIEPERERRHPALGEGGHDRGRQPEERSGFLHRRRLADARTARRSGGPELRFEEAPPEVGEEPIAVQGTEQDVGSLRLVEPEPACLDDALERRKPARGRDVREPLGTLPQETALAPIGRQEEVEAPVRVEVGPGRHEGLVEEAEHAARQRDVLELAAGVAKQMAASLGMEDQDVLPAVGVEVAQK